MQKQKVAKTFIWLCYALYLFCLDTSATLSPQYDEKVDCHDSAKAESRNDESGQIRASFVVDSQRESQSK